MLVHVDNNSDTTLSVLDTSQGDDSSDASLLNGMLKYCGEVVAVELLHQGALEVSGEPEGGTRHVLRFVAAVEVGVGELDPFLNFCQTLARGYPDDHVLVLADPLPVKTATLSWNVNVGVLIVLEDGVRVVRVESAPHVVEDLLFNWFALDVQIELLLTGHPAV